jgi:bacterioferritin
MEGQKKFGANTAEIKRRARENLEAGAVTAGYKGDIKEVIEMLNGALATELVCVLRYRRHYFMAKGIAAEPVAAEFLEHSNQELEHADMLSERIAQLGGAPNLNPKGMAERATSEYIEGTDLKKMIEEDLIAERVAIDTYREMISFVGDNDPTTRRVLEEILAVEEEHADDMSKLISRMGFNSNN